MSSNKDPATWSEFFRLIDECSELIESSESSVDFDVRRSSDSLPSLLEQCSALIEEADQGDAPVRVLSHLACTGGTLIGKAIASMPNTVLLSEVAPYSQLVDRGNRYFPSDLIQLSKLSNHAFSETLPGQIFRNGLRAVYDECQAQGARLILRDHAHSKYSVGSQVEPTPSLKQELSSEFDVRGVVTVRHPLDSFLSLINNRWRHFEPFTLEEYGRRYQRYLDDHDEWSWFKYEAFIKEPLATAEALCESLALPFNENFESLFGVQQLSGDSGRSSSTIGVRARRPLPVDVVDQLENSPAYRALCDRLGYDWRPDREAVT